MVRAILNVYIIVIIIDTVLSYLPQYENTVWAKKIKKVADFTLNPVRKFIVERFLPPNLTIDVSPLIVIVAIKLIEVFW